MLERGGRYLKEETKDKPCDEMKIDVNISGSHSFQIGISISNYVYNYII